MTTPFQPTLPNEVPFTEAEISFMDDSPPGLYPENQNSNYGLLRKANTDQIQELIDQLNLLYNERFVRTSETFIDVWEQEVGLPVNPQGKTLDQRRVAVLGRIQKGPFTRARRAQTVEGFIVATFGGPIQLFPEGVALSPTGTPLYAEFADPATLYEIRENNPTGKNILPNGNFENNVNGWAPSNTTISVDGTTARYGTKSMKGVITATSNQWYIAQVSISGATAGRSYTGSVWVKGQGSSIGKPFYCYVDTNGSVGGVEVSAVSSLTLTASWQKISATLTLTANNHTLLRFVPYQGAPAVNDVNFLDGAMVEVSDTPTSFQDPEKTPYYYEVRIKSNVTPDAGLARELTRITPAGISFDILFPPDIYSS